ncbi:hypothetical protein [Sporosarcina cascadiensis]|uniref:hypothetical protein n=1 Tax=Sporosarcina cascadiensis TaxID=2660747 RepID=UPI00129BFFF3|nr:hypothetical protein [Sporosarcina cascadiensis]
MTHYYYLSSDKRMNAGSGSLDFNFMETEISGFDYPIQIEMQSLEKKWELRELLQYIHNHTAPYEVCHMQIANLLSSNRVGLEIVRKSEVYLHEITDVSQLLLQEGSMLTIKKNVES